MKKLFFFFPALLTWSACSFEKGEVPVAEIPCDSNVSYSATVTPLVANACLGCHTPGGEGPGDFSNYSELKIAADNGSLKRVVYTLKSMPPAGNPGLTDEERAKIRCWVEQGASEN